MTLPSIQLFALNIAIASSLCLAISLGLSKAFMSLPKRYATLVVGLIAGLLAPLLVGVGTWYALGQLPAIIKSDSLDNVPVAIDIGLPTPDQLPRDNEYVQPLLSDQSLPASSSVPYSPKLVINEKAGGVAIVNDATRSNTRPTWPMIIGTLLLALWAAGSLTLFLIQLRKLMLCKQFLMRCEPIQDTAVQKLFERTKQRLGISRDVRLLESAALPTPVVIGWWRPSVILPTEIQFSLTGGQLASVLTHELSHIRRKDHCVAMLQSLADILYWWNPLNRFISRRMNELREMICDDIATVNNQAPREYAQTIVQMAARSVATRELAGSLGISLSPISELERRLTRIIADRTGNVDVSISKRFTTALLAMSVLLVSGLLFAQVPQANEPKAPADAKQPVKEDANASNKPRQPNFKPVSLSGQVVDAALKPVANANVYLESPNLEIDARTTADAEGHYHFDDLKIPNRGYVGLKLWAESADKTQQGYYIYPYGKSIQLENVQIKIEPTKQARIQVVDANGKPIAGANAGIVLSPFLPIGPQKTDANGIAQFQVPQSIKIVSAVAWKDGRGLDCKYYTLPRERQSDLNAKAPEFPTSIAEVLRLEGAAPLTIQVTDADSKPLANSKVFFSMKRRDNLDEYFDGFAGWFGADTNANGIATLSWFPAWQKGEVHVYAHANGFLHGHVVCVPNDNSTEAKLVMQPAAAIRGRITFPDGTPAPNVMVDAMVSESEDGLRAFSISDGDGNYELFVPPDTYDLSVQDNKWDADIHYDVSTALDESAENRDFVLLPLTRLHGKITDDSTGQGIPKARVHLSPDMRSMTPKSPDYQKLIKKNRRLHNAHSNPFTNEQGEFEYYVGNGDYLMSVEGTLEARIPIMVSIQGESDKEVNHVLNAVGESELIGRVTSRETGKPLPGIIVSSNSPTFSTQDQWQAVTDDKGQFKVRSKRIARTISASSEDKTLGIIVAIGPDQTQLDLRLVPPGSATGRLMTQDGSQPASNTNISLALNEPIQGGGSSLRPVETVVTDAQGNFTFKQLFVGGNYTLTLPDARGTIGLKYIPIKVQSGKTTDLGDIRKM